MAALSATLLRYITHHAAAASPDAVLLQRFVADRDGDAFAGLVRRHGPIVYRVCRRLLGPTAADDAFQATFLVLATRAASVRKAGSVGSWMVGVAGRVARQMRKAERRREVREIAAATIPIRDGQNDRREAGEQARILEEELTRLSDRLRGPVVACLLQGRTYEQAACELGGSARTVRRRLDEAKRVLRARLEGRGVVPAVAAGLMAGISSVDAAVPAGLGSRTTVAVSGFLAGGATIPAALIAKGVATTMTTSMRIVSALVATAAVGLTALGVGLAGQNPSGSAPAVVPPVPVENPRAIRQAPPAPTVSTSLGRGSVPTAPSDAAIRAIENEAKYQSDSITRLWFGQGENAARALMLDVCGAAEKQSIPPPPDHSLRIMYWSGSRGRQPAHTQLTFDGDKLRRAWIDLRGDLENVLDDQLPREMVSVFLTRQLGAKLPWWAQEGIASTFVPTEAEAGLDEKCRTELREGRAVRLPALFAMNDPPPDDAAARAQAHSVVRFLIRAAPGPATIDGPHPGYKALLEFLRQGTRGGWTQAASAVYGFADLNVMEAAWLQWMKRPDSKLPEPATVVTPPPAAVPASSLIPPVKLP